MLFKDIPGQEKSKEYLSSLISEDRIPHAMLFTGPEGNGKLAMAMAFASRLLCENSKGLDSCGECDHCHKSLKSIHPDIHFAFPISSKEGKKREDTTSIDFLADWRNFLQSNLYGGVKGWIRHIDAENKAININVTECNQIIKSLGLRKYEGKFKIQIIWGAEYLSKEGNRLLKLIEEPTPDTIIILLTDKEQLVLNTIKSRCQIFKVPPFKDSNVDEFLQAKISDSKAREELVRLSAGNLMVAQELCEREETGWDSMLLQIFRSSFTGKVTDMMKQSEQLANFNKKEMEGFCLYTIHFLKEYIKIVNLNGLDSIRLSNSEKSTALKMTKRITADMAFEISQLMEENLRNIYRNANKKILWSSTMFGMEEIFNKKKIAI